MFYDTDQLMKDLCSIATRFGYTVNDDFDNYSRRLIYEDSKIYFQVKGNRAIIYVPVGVKNNYLHPVDPYNLTTTCAVGLHIMNMAMQVENIETEDDKYWKGIK